MGAASLLIATWLPLVSASTYHVGNGCADVEVSPKADVEYQGGLTTEGWAVPPANVDGGFDKEKLGDVDIDLNLPLADYAGKNRGNVNLSEAEIKIDQMHMSPDGKLSSNKGLFSTREIPCQ